MTVLLSVRGPLEIEIIEHFATLDPPIDITRRCADTVELLASAAAGLGSVAVVSDMDLVTAAELHTHGVRIIGIAGAEGTDGNRGCDQLASPFAPEVAACIRNLSLEPMDEPQQPAIVPTAGRGGKVIAVWGSSGSPGRSSIARDLANAFAGSGRTLLVDGDIYQPSVAQMLALGQETSAIVAAFRALNAGERGHQLVERACAGVAGFQFLAGLNSAARWRELPESVAAEFWPILREGWDWSVVDCASEAQRDEYAYQNQRDGFTLSLLEQADEVLLVGQPGALGIRRLLDQCDVAAELGVNARVLINRAPRDRAAISQLLHEYGTSEILWVREDTGAMCSAVESGQLLAEAVPKSAALRDIAAVARACGSDLLQEGRAREARRRRKNPNRKGKLDRAKELLPVTPALPEPAGQPKLGAGRHRRIG
ncbi:MAG: AAA family ATPase [Ancrocorticia sp.]|uniref:AAA family ATPase n=1 Tax=Ancrocorticia sp. TaxID=2593684 RepID=UPI003F934328